MRGSKLLSLLTALAMVAVLAAQVDAQQGQNQGQGQGQGQGQRGRGRGGFGAPGGFPGGGGKLGLLIRDEVKRELELLDEQSADIVKLSEELRAQRTGDFPDFRNMTDEERRAAFEKMRAEREALSEEERTKQDEERRAQQLARQKEADAKLAEILLPHQMDRLSQIELQQQGLGALMSEDVTKALGLSEEAKADLMATMRASGEKVRAEVQALIQSGNRDGIREKMEEFQKKIEADVLAKLTQAQRDKFTEMKGEPFDLPRGGFGFGGPRPGGGGQGGGQDGNGGGRPRRPATE